MPMGNVIANVEAFLKADVESCVGASMTANEPSVQTL